MRRMRRGSIMIVLLGGAGGISARSYHVPVDVGHHTGRITCSKIHMIIIIVITITVVLLTTSI